MSNRRLDSDVSAVRATISRFSDRMASDAESTAVRSGAATQPLPPAALLALDRIETDLIRPLEAQTRPLEREDGTQRVHLDEEHREEFHGADLSGQVLEEIRDYLESIKVPGARYAKPADTWTELDVDSLDLVELVQALEDRFNITFSDYDFKPVASVSDAIELTVRLVEDTEWTRT